MGNNKNPFPEETNKPDQYLLRTLPQTVMIFRTWSRRFRAQVLFGSAVFEVKKEVPASMPFPDDLDTFLGVTASAGTANSKDKFENVWKIIQECAEEERHFNMLQSVYRGVASTWLLATFGAVGFLLFDKDGKATHPWMAGGICMLGALGICLLWMLDLHIYHRLLEAAFDQAYALEKKFPWLPQIRSESRKCTKSSVRMRLASYYFFTTLAPAAVGVGLLYKYGYHDSAVLVCVAWAIVVFILWVQTAEKDV